MKKEHALKDVPLTVIPHYDDFEELKETKTKTSDYSGDHLLDSRVMYYIKKTQKIDEKFDFKTMKFDEEASRFYFTKQFDDPKDATEFKNKLKEFLQSFVKEELRIPKTVFEKVKEDIKSKRDEFEADKVDFHFDGLQVILVGKKENVVHKKRSIEATIDRILEEAKSISADVMVNDRNKLKFLNFINYFKNAMTEFPELQIMESPFGKLSLLGTAEKAKDFKLMIYQDLAKISEIDVKTNVRQIDFLQRTQCKIVNDELKKDDAMLLLINVERAVGNEALQAKILTLKKCDDSEVRSTKF